MQLCEHLLVSVTVSEIPLNHRLQLDDDEIALWSTNVKCVYCSIEARAQLEGHTHFVDGSGSCDAVDLCYASSSDQISAVRFGPPCRQEF